MTNTNHGAEAREALNILGNWAVETEAQEAIRTHIRSYITASAAEVERHKRAAEVTHEEIGTEIARLEAEVSALKAQVEALTADLDTANDRVHEADMQPWPKWADDIRKKLMEYGYDAGPEGEWNIGECMDSWIEGCLENERAETERLKAQVEGAADRDALYRLAHRMGTDVSDLLSIIERMDHGKFEGPNDQSAFKMISKFYGAWSGDVKAFLRHRDQGAE